MHYLTKRINELSLDERDKILEELIETTVNVPETTIDQSIFTIMSEYTEEAIERNKHFGKMQGLSSGYRKIDELTKGFVGGELTVIAGKTSYGKTTVAINIANKVALNGTAVLFVTLEMTKVEITSRFVNINGGATDEYHRVAPLIAYQVTDELSWRSIDKLVERAVKELNVGLVVIDHLHYFSRETEKVAEDLGRITKELSKNAKRHNVPVILISHVRKTESNKAAGIDDLRGSSYIAQDADIVLMIGRKKDDQTSIRVDIQKNRNRGYNYAASEAEMYLDGITLYDNEPIF